MADYIFEHNKDLFSLTTFHISAFAELYAEYSSVKELIRLSRTEEFINNEVLHIGGGSNLLFTGNFNGLVIHSAIKGFKIYEKDRDNVFVIAGAGEKWTDFVDFCLDSGLAGAENLAGIPGEVGAAPVQNVGAYGVEAKDIIHSVEVFDTETREILTLENKDCGFSYRDSRFKHEWKGRYFVVRVSFRLKKNDIAENLEYGPLKLFKEKSGGRPTIKEVAKEIIHLRNAKLPDPDKIGSAGSFFKNPIVGRYYFEEAMQALTNEIPYHDIDENLVKVPAGWLIEQAGLKGFKVGGAFVYPDQCLVLANSGEATAEDVVALSKIVVDKVREKFAVILQPEVNFIDTSIEVTILGSGTSKGVPEVACGCRVCRSGSPYDKRRRASVLVRTHGMNILIDVSPDFRMQALGVGLTSLDAVLITHNHYDHVGGFDDLRPFCAHRDLPVYLQKNVNDDLHHRLDYCFRKHPYPGVPQFEMHEIGDKDFKINGLKITPITVMHGRMPILGYRINDFAYITDAKTIPEEELEKLQSLKVLVINALRERPHFAHLSFSEAFEIIDKVKPEEAYITHFNHEAGLHEELVEKFPSHVHPCFDGLTIKLE